MRGKSKHVMSEGEKQVRNNSEKILKKKKKVKRKKEKTKEAM